MGCVFPIHSNILAILLTSELGNVVYVDFLGTPVYILNSFKDAVDVFEKQGAKSSGRPRLVMCGEMLGWDRFVVFSQYGERLRTSRRLFHQYIGGRGQLETTLEKVGELEEAETLASCRRILQDPDSAHLGAHISRSVDRVIIIITS